MKRNILTAFVFLAVAISVAAQGGGETSLNELEYLLEPSELRDYLADPPDGFFLVDARTPEEYAAGHIPSAIQIDYRDIGRMPPSDNKDAFIIVYCQSGNRSNTAANTLAALGYTRVLDWGGITSWPYDVVTGSDPE